MSPHPSTARSARRQQAFQALDALGKHALRGVSYARAAALAGTTITYVNAWVEARGYANVLAPRRLRPAEESSLSECDSAHTRK